MRVVTLQDIPILPVEGAAEQTAVDGTCISVEADHRSARGLSQLQL